MDDPQDSADPVMARATYLASGLGPRRAEERKGPPPRPTLESLGEGRWAVLFRYGAAATVGLSDAEHAAFLHSLGDRVSNRLARPETEVSQVRISSEVETIDSQGRVVVPGLDPARVLILLEVLARSAVLTVYEHSVAEAVERVEPLAERLRSGRRLRIKETPLLKQIGETLLIQTRMVGRAEVLDRPEVLWDHPELDRFYDRLAGEYELQERDRALTRKLELVGDVSRTLNDLLQEKQILRVEWYIVALILFEIVLTLWDRLVG